MANQDNPKYRVLLVDDEKEQLDKIKDIIGKSNSLKEFIESTDTFLVNRQKGTEEIANQIKENPDHWDIILSDLFMPTNEEKGSLGGLLIADALIPYWESNPEFPIKLIIISNKGAAGGKLREYSPRYDKWIYWYPKPKTTHTDISRNDLAPLPLWSLAIAEAIVKLNQDIIEEPLAEEVLQIGLSGSMRIVKTFADIASKNKDNVLILGERGAGKEVLARYIHDKLFGEKAPFIKHDCQYVPSNYSQMDLFGVVPNYKEYPSQAGKIGKFYQANKGTIFLNEIGEIKDDDEKLLQVLDPEYRIFGPMGAESFLKFEGKIICASSKPFEELVKSGLFSKKICGLINCSGIVKLTSLRERKEDIIPLANYFIRNYLCESSEIRLSEKVKNLLEKHHWPDTFEEFKTAVDQAGPHSNPEESIPEEDIVSLTNYFIKKCSFKFRGKKKLSEEAINLLEKYDWPNNVKELKEAIDQAILISDTEELIPTDFYGIFEKITINSEHCPTKLLEINLSTLPPDKFVLEIARSRKRVSTLIKESGLDKFTFNEKFKNGLDILLKGAGGNVSMLERTLGKSNRYFYEFIKRFGLKHTTKGGFYSSTEK